jgi:RsiW-degrading membrane proteinase PrsW (M82 family)
LIGGLVVAAAVFLWQLPFFTRAGGGAFLTNVWYHAYVLIWLLVITALGRTLPLRVLAAAFFVGMFPAMAVVLGIGFPLAGMLGTGSRLFDSVLVPVLEESAKSLPVLLFFWFLARRGTWQPSMTDGLLLGFLVGAGYALHEDAMKSHVFGSGFDGSELGFIFPTIQDERVRGVGRVFSFYHAEWTALMGLSIGAAFFFRQRFRLSWLIPVAALAVIWLDHGGLNYMIHEAGGGISGVLRAPVLHGRLPVYLLLAGIVASVVTEVRLLRTMARRDYLFKGISMTTLLSWLRAGGVAGLRRIQAVREYIRTRRSIHYALWRARPGGITPEQVTGMGLMLLSLGERAGLTFAEPGMEDEPVPPAAR